MNEIEKCAKLMGYTIAERKPDFNYYHLDADSVGTFDPLTNKSDLMDLECALGIDIDWIDFNVAEGFVHANVFVGDEMLKHLELFADHPDKFTSRAHAVIAVAVQIYDRTNP